MTQVDGAADRLPVLRMGPFAAAMVLWGWAGVWWRLGTGWLAIASALLAFLLCLGVLSSLLIGRRFVAVAIHGQSMEPAFMDGDWVLVRRGQAPARGQVVVVEHPELNLLLPNGGPATMTIRPQRRWLIKRVAAVPGDPVPRDRVPSLATVSEPYVPPGKLVLLGDNQQASFDSRRLGYFSSDEVLGAVVRRLAIGHGRRTA